MSRQKSWTNSISKSAEATPERVGPHIPERPHDFDSSNQVESSVDDNDDPFQIGGMRQAHNEKRDNFFAKSL